VSEKKIKVNPYTEAKGGLWANCTLCPAQEPSMNKSLGDWVMQHFHFGDVEYEFLLCDKCQGMSQMKIFEKLFPNGELKKDLELFPAKTIN